MRWWRWGGEVRRHHQPRPPSARGTVRLLGRPRSGLPRSRGAGVRRADVKRGVVHEGGGGGDQGDGGGGGVKSAVTISLVPEARGGPFVFWDGLEAGCREAAALGFDAVEVFAPGRSALPDRETRD